MSFQTNFQETSNAKSLAVIYCLAFISVWLFNDLNTKYIYHIVPKGVKERTSTEMVEVLTKGSFYSNSSHSSPTFALGAGTQKRISQIWQKDMNARMEKRKFSRPPPQIK